jgi:hypothetical protein
VTEVTESSPAGAAQEPSARSAHFAPSAMTDSMDQGVAVLISKSMIFVDDTPVVSVPIDAILGVEAQYKRSGRRDFYIVPLANALGAWRERDRQVRASPGKDPIREAIVIADANTPYRLLTEVLFTLGQSDFASFHLMALQSAKGN